MKMNNCPFGSIGTIAKIIVVPDNRHSLSQQEKINSLKPHFTDMKKGTKIPAKVRRIVSKDAVILETEAEQLAFAHKKVSEKNVIVPLEDKAVVIKFKDVDGFVDDQLARKGMHAVSVKQESTGSVIKSITDTEAIEKIEEVLHYFALPKRKFVIQAVIGKTIADFKSLVHSLKNDKEAAENRLKNISDAVNASTVDLRDFEELLPQ